MVSLGVPRTTNGHRLQGQPVVQCTPVSEVHLWVRVLPLARDLVVFRGPTVGPGSTYGPGSACSLGPTYG